MTCRSFRPRLGRYADGELSEPEAQEIRVHLLDCPRCRSVVASVVSVKRFFAGADAERMRAPAGFADRVVALAAAGGGSEDADPARRLGRRLSALAASVALVAGGVLLERSALLEGSPDALEAQEWDASRREITRRLDPSALLDPTPEPGEEAPAPPRR